VGGPALIIILSGGAISATSESSKVIENLLHEVVVYTLIEN